MKRLGKKVTSLTLLSIALFSVSSISKQMDVFAKTEEYIQLKEMRSMYQRDLVYSLEEIVSIPDEKLKVAINKSLGKVSDSEITKSDLKRLTSLTAHYNIKNL